MFAHHLGKKWKWTPRILWPNFYCKYSLHKLDCTKKSKIHEVDRNSHGTSFSFIEDKRCFNHLNFIKSKLCDWLRTSWLECINIQELHIVEKSSIPTGDCSMKGYTSSIWFWKLIWFCLGKLRSEFLPLAFNFHDLSMFDASHYHITILSW